jgi:hypothetical protein
MVRAWVVVMSIAMVGISAAQNTDKELADQVSKASLPLVVYGNADASAESPFIASGWMGNTDAIEYDDASKENPHSGETCIRVKYADTSKWGGIVWQSPADDWGDEPGGWDLTGAKQLIFWARGDKGGETVEFKLGILPKSKPYHDSGSATLGKIKLTPEWKQYTLGLTGKNLTRIKTGFVFSVAGTKEPVTFFLDDIQYE